MPQRFYGVGIPSSQALMAKIVSVNISKQKGTAKRSVEKVTVTSLGLKGDAHAGIGHRQISLLGKEQILAFGKKHKEKFTWGDFGENLTVEGLDFAQIKVGDQVKIDDVLLEVTQIGKSCHGKECNIFHRIGVCVMPKAGVFARVLHGGSIYTGDKIEHIKQLLRIGIITASDRASRGEYSDESGPLIKTIMEKFCANNGLGLICDITVVADEAIRIRQAIKIGLAKKCDVLITTGGTGLGPRDVTVEVIRKLLDREIPGIMEYIRFKYGTKTPMALLSRSVAGAIKKTLVFALPGSPKAVEEYMLEINKILLHALAMVRGLGH